MPEAQIPDPGACALAERRRPAADQRPGPEPDRPAQPRRAHDRDGHALGAGPRRPDPGFCLLTTSLTVSMDPSVFEAEPCPRHHSMQSSRGTLRRTTPIVQHISQLTAFTPSLLGRYCACRRTGTSARLLAADCVTIHVTHGGSHLLPVYRATSRSRTAGASTPS